MRSSSKVNLQTYARRSPRCVRVRSGDLNSYNEGLCSGHGRRRSKECALRCLAETLSIDRSRNDSGTYEPNLSSASLTMWICCGDSPRLVSLHVELDAWRSVPDTYRSLQSDFTSPVPGKQSRSICTVGWTSD